MATSVGRILQKRVDDDDYDDDDDVNWWYSDTATTVKWVAFSAIVLLFMIWIIGGHWHAKRRIEKGLRPLAYHRCFVSRRMMARVDPRYACPPQTYMYSNYPPPPDGYNYSYAPNPNGYQMNNMPPPPIYDPSRPPQYEAPPGASKVDPNQARDRREDGPA